LALHFGWLAQASAAGLTVDGRATPAARALHGARGAVDALLELGLEDEGEEGARDVAANKAYPVHSG